MLKTEDIAKIAGILRIDENTLTEALRSNDEVSLEVGSITSLTAQELEQRDKNNKNLGYNEGKEAGEEMVVKELKRKHEISIEGKDPSTFAEAFKSKILADAKVEPTQQLKEQQEAFGKLQKSYELLEEEKKSLNQTIEQMNVKHQLLSEIPKNKLRGEELIAVMNANGYSFEKSENGITAKLNGSVVRNQTTQAEIAFGDVIAGFITEKGFAEESEPKKGRGGKSDKNNVVITNITELKKQWEDEGKSVNSAEFQAACVEHAKNNQDFFK